MADRPQRLINHIAGGMCCDWFQAKINALRHFKDRAAYLAHQLMASVIHAEIASSWEIYLVFLEVPGELEAVTPCPSRMPIPYLMSSKNPPEEKELRHQCAHAWTKAMTLIQYWEDVENLYEYGGLVRHYSKLMVFIFYRINLVLKCHGV